jgi:predicted Zn-dependent protease
MTISKKFPLMPALALLSLMAAVPGGARADEQAPVDSSAEGVHLPSLIAQSNGMERRFLYQNLIVEDKDLTDYLSDILEKLAVPEERRRYNLRVRVLRSNVFNAFAAPNGTVFVCAGLLSRVANEAQAAAVLAHELAHIVLEHTEKNFLELKRQTREAAMGQSRRNPEALILGDGIAGSVIGDAQRSAISGYEERIELQADSLAIIRMAAVGYRPPADFRKFIYSIRDGLEEANVDKRKSLSSGVAAVDEDDIDRGYFNVKLSGIILNEAAMSHAAGRPELVEPLLGRLLAVDSCDVAALIRRGDMERQLAPRSSVAIEWYDKALTCSPGNPAALRAIGFAYHSLGRTEEACRYLRGYCKMAGGAADIKMARELLRRCDERGAAK